ncbi:hypothetical protein [Gloeothece verrucosa]|uniref:Sulfotransferase domain-containing protein n=1 Tax=Gloeothece verrucosa (strain PCC 7822) TaxID=497965 RepID=E0ULK3_GLOV7|nr:hypothetical protein [Gloeothece verrucosa]ADN17833.1 hypothetical protein Cyan7822_5985 [Gloeothece verrucosa PCC 7822]
MSDMIKLYLHIGTPKTGTSTLQHFLTVKRQELLKEGFLYPLAGTIDFDPGILMSHEKLSIAIKHELNIPVSYKLYKQEEWRNTLKTEWNRLHDEINKHSGRNVVISAESFSDFELEGIKLIKKNLSNSDVKIVVYIRQQDEFYQSWYNQKVKIGIYGKDIHQFITEDRPDYIYYYNFLQSWRKVFGKENIILRVFEKQQLKNGLIGDFLEAISFKENKDYLKNIDFINESPSIQAIKFMRIFNNLIMNKMYLSYPVRQKINHLLRIKLSKKNESFSTKLFNNIIGLLFKDTQDVVLTHQEKIDILKEFEENNQKVAQEYFGRQDGRLFLKSQSK